MVGAGKYFQREGKDETEHSPVTCNRALWMVDGKAASRILPQPRRQVHLGRQGQEVQGPQGITRIH